MDRGSYGLECVALLICYKVKFPDKLYMLRGNHECGPISRIYGFYDEVKRRSAAHRFEAARRSEWDVCRAEVLLRSF